MCFAIILPMKDIDVRWVENSKTKKTSLKTISREKYNDYPEGTATVQLENIKSKNSDAKVWFIFEILSSEPLLGLSLIVDLSLFFINLLKDFVFWNFIVFDGSCSQKMLPFLLSSPIQRL